MKILDNSLVISKHNKWEEVLAAEVLCQAIKDIRCEEINEETGCYDIRNNAVKWLKSKRLDKFLEHTNINPQYIRESVKMEEKSPLTPKQLHTYMVAKHGENYVGRNKKPTKCPPKPRESIAYYTQTIAYKHFGKRLKDLNDYELREFYRLQSKLHRERNKQKEEIPC